MGVSVAIVGIVGIVIVAIVAIVFGKKFTVKLKDNENLEVIIDGETERETE